MNENQNINYISKKRDRSIKSEKGSNLNLPYNPYQKSNSIPQNINFLSNKINNIINVNNINIQTNIGDSNKIYNISNLKLKSKKLTIYQKKDEILNTINKNQVAIITGNTDCGKTTEVTQIIYEYNKSKNSPVKILITQQRRIAVLNIAERLCEEMNCKKGDLVGYHYALSEVFYSEKTDILIETTVIFLEKLIHGGDHIDKYTHIILDKVH